MAKRKKNLTVETALRKVAEKGEIGWASEYWYEQQGWGDKRVTSACVMGAMAAACVNGIIPTAEDIAEEYFVESIKYGTTFRERCNDFIWDYLIEDPSLLVDKKWKSSQPSEREYPAYEAWERKYRNFLFKKLKVDDLTPAGQAKLREWFLDQAKWTISGDNADLVERVIGTDAFHKLGEIVPQWNDTRLEEELLSEWDYSRERPKRNDFKTEDDYFIALDDYDWEREDAFREWLGDPQNYGQVWEMIIDRMADEYPELMKIQLACVDPDCKEC